MMDDLTNKTALVYDLSGTYTFIAEALVNDFGRVLYHVEWESGFPQPLDRTPGEGLEGVERIADPFDYLDQVDLVIFPDVGKAGLQEWLRRQGIPVWGSGLHGNLERDRLALKRELMGLGMDVPEYEVYHGLTALEEYLQNAPPCWIKVSFFRGLTETHHFRGDLFLSQGWLDDITTKLGPYREEVDFIVEMPIEGDAVEVGIDAHAINGILPRRMMWGYEQKDEGYIGTTLALPPRLSVVSQQFMPALAGYCGPLSTEVRMTAEGAFLVDLTARYPSPPSEAEVLNIRNFAQLAYDGARGIPTEADYRCKYVAQFVMKSSVLGYHSLGLKVGIPERTVIHGHCRFDGYDYACSPLRLEEFAGAVGLNDDLEDACAEAIEVAEAVEGDGVTFNRNALREIMDVIEQGEGLGLKWGVE